MKAVILIGFLSFPILSQITQLFGFTFARILIFSMSMNLWVHHDKLIWWNRFLNRTLGSGSTAVSEFWTDPSGTGWLNALEGCSLYKFSGARDLQSYSQGLGTEKRIWSWENQGQNTSPWAWHCWTPGLVFLLICSLSVQHFNWI